MGAFFSLDSKFMQAMTRIADLVLLNLLFLITCLPLITIGAASAALYTVCFRIGTDREQGVCRSYFRAFCENFGQGTLLWLILTLFAIAGLANALLLYSLEGWLHYLFIVTLILLILAVLMFSYTFPLISQFSNDIRSTLKNALCLSVGYLPRSLLISVLNVFPLVLALVDLYLFLRVGFVWIFLYFSAAAYINTLLLRKVFAPYLSQPAD